MSATMYFAPTDEWRREAAWRKDPSWSTNHDMSSLIADEPTLHAFLSEIKRRFPDDAYRFNLVVLARRKYGCVRDQPIHRTITSLSDVVEELKRIAALDGGFTYKGTFFPMDGIAVYMTVEPCDIVAANRATAIEYLNALRPAEFRMDRAFLTNCQKHSLSRRVLDMDVDDKSLWPALRESLGRADVLVESQGGYHALYVDLDKRRQKLAHDSAKLYGKIEVNKNNLVPLPGTFQHGFAVKWMDRVGS